MYLSVGSQAEEISMCQEQYYQERIEMRCYIMEQALLIPYSLLEREREDIP